MRRDSLPANDLDFENAVRRGLLWHEWLLHRPFLSWSVAIWVCAIWVVCFFSHPGFILGFGVIYAVIVGTRLGGMDAIEGSVEFTFALPPTRRQRYAIRLLVALGSVIVLTLLGLVSVHYNWPQAVWGCFVSSGFTEPYVGTKSPTLFVYTLLLPASVLLTSFGFGNMARSRKLGSTCGILGVALVGGLVALGHYLEYQFLGTRVGKLAIPMVALAATVIAIAGYRVFLAKDGVMRPDSRKGSFWWIWLVLAIGIALFFVLFVGVASTKRAEVGRAHRTVQRAHENAVRRANAASKADAISTSEQSTAEEGEK